MKKETSINDGEKIEQELREVLEQLNRNGVIAGTGDQIQEVRDAKEKLIDLIDEITSAIGEILASHVEMTEGVLGASVTLATKKKIAALRARIESEKVRLAKSKAVEAKRKALKIRKKVSS